MLTYAKDFEGLSDHDKRVYALVAKLGDRQARLLMSLNEPLWRSFDGTVLPIRSMDDRHLDKAISLMLRENQQGAPVFLQLQAEQKRRMEKRLEQHREFCRNFVKHPPKVLPPKPPMPVPTEDEHAEARALIAEGWLSISNKYYSIARLPEGMNGREALRWAMLQHQGGKLSKHEEEHVENFGMRSATGQFLRVHTVYEFAKHCRRELTPSLFRAFKLEGGQSA